MFHYNTGRLILHGDRVTMEKRFPNVENILLTCAADVGALGGTSVALWLVHMLRKPPCPAPGIHQFPKHYGVHFVALLTSCLTGGFMTGSHRDTQTPLRCLGGTLWVLFQQHNWGFTICGALVMESDCRLQNLLALHHVAIYIRWVPFCQMKLQSRYAYFCPIQLCFWPHVYDPRLTLPAPRVCVYAVASTSAIFSHESTHEGARKRTIMVPLFTAWTHVECGS